MRSFLIAGLGGLSLYVLQGLPIWLLTQVLGFDLVLGDWGLLWGSPSWTIGVASFTVVLAVGLKLVAGRRRTLGSVAVVLAAASAYPLPELIRIAAAYGDAGAADQMLVAVYLATTAWLNLWVAVACAGLAVRIAGRSGPVERRRAVPAAG